MTTDVHEQDSVLQSLYGNNLRRVPIARATSLAAYELVDTDIRVILRHDPEYPIPVLVMIHQGGLERKDMCRWRKPNLGAAEEEFRGWPTHFLWLHSRVGEPTRLFIIEVVREGSIPKLREIKELDDKRPKEFIWFAVHIQARLLEYNWMR